MEEKEIYNIIVAAGKGSRFGTELPKQFCLLNNRPVLIHTIERMRRALPQSNIIVVINKDFNDMWLNLCHIHNFISPTVIHGGNTRWQSVKNALDFIGPLITDKSIITIHDGARPIITTELVKRVINGLQFYSGAIPVIPVTDSLRMSMPDGTSTPVDRAIYKAVQTPQAFNAVKLLHAYSFPYCDNFTDDASVMAAAGYSDISLIEGNSHNIKITLPHDIEIASIYFRENEPAT